jgi:hypothetical protein
LNALRIILGKKTQILIAYLNFGPHTFGQHIEEPDITIILHVESLTRVIAAQFSHLKFTPSLSLDTPKKFPYSYFVKLKPQGPEFSCRVAEGTGPTTPRQPVEQQALHPVPIPAPSRGGTWEFRRRFPNTLTPDLKD